MRTNRAAFYLLTVLAIGIAFCYSSCKKNNGDACDNMMCGGGTFAEITIKNGQNKDLLDPATPGHYDTAYIKRSNTWFIVSAPGVSPVRMVFDYFKVQGTQKLILSDEDQSDLTISEETISEKCNMFTHLVDLKYNGVALKADSVTGSLFVVRK